MESITFEEYFWKRYGFILPDKHSIENIKEFADETILEIGFRIVFFTEEDDLSIYNKLLLDDDIQFVFHPYRLVI